MAGASGSLELPTPVDPAASGTHLVNTAENGAADTDGDDVPIGSATGTAARSDHVAVAVPPAVTRLLERIRPSPRHAPSPGTTATCAAPDLAPAPRASLRNRPRDGSGWRTFAASGPGRNGADLWIGLSG